MKHTAPRFALNSQTTPNASLQQFAAAAAGAGFAWVECSAAVLSDDTADTLAVLAEHHLTVIGVSPSEGLLDWHHAWNPELHERMERELRRAADLGSDYFVLPFMRPLGDRASVERALGQAVPLARDLGMRLAVEPIGHYDVLRRAEALAPLLRQQDGSVVSLLLDSFHFFRAGHVVDDLTLYAGIPVAGIQLSNINDRTDNEAFGYRDRTFPLDGRWPVREFAIAASRLFPSAPLIVEVIGQVAAATSTDEAAARAHAHLNLIEHHIPEAARG